MSPCSWPIHALLNLVTTWEHQGGTCPAKTGNTPSAPLGLGVCLPLNRGQIGCKEDTRNTYSNEWRREDTPSAGLEKQCPLTWTPWPISTSPCPYQSRGSHKLRWSAMGTGSGSGWCRGPLPADCGCFHRAPCRGTRHGPMTSSPLSNRSSHCTFQDECCKHTQSLTS